MTTEVKWNELAAAGSTTPAVGSAERALPATWHKRLRLYAFALVAYVLATWASEPHFMADTVFYAEASVSGERERMWEFGHLLWRPMGRALAILGEPLLRQFVGADMRAQVVLAMVAVSWLTGLLSVLCLAGIVRRFCEREWPVYVAVCALIFAHGFLNFTQAGASYVAGLGFLALALYLLVRSGDHEGRRLRLAAAGAGMALALAVAMWFLFIWSVPAVIVAPLFLTGWNRRNLRLVAWTTLACAAGGALLFGTGAALLGIYTPEGFRAWILKASHGATSSGLARMLFGFARSFVNMGNDGILFKRFLLRDPYNPVSLVEIFRLSLWKLAFFYLFLAAIVVNLVRSPVGRRVLALLFLSAAPMLVFAALWQGGDIERYLPLYPLVFLALGVALDTRRGLPVLRYVALLFVVVMGATSFLVMAKPVLRAQEESVMARLRELQPRLKPESRVVTVHQQDELWRANYSFPFNPFFRRHANLVYAAANLGTVRTLRWREDFAARAVAVWDAGGDVWISRRFFAERPRAEWNWTEGGSPVTWNDLRSFFAGMEMGESAGGEDGFTLLLRSTRNEQLLRELAARPDEPQAHAIAGDTP